MKPELHLNNFNGPLELLLQLINKNKMSIYDIQITVITKQYLRSLKKIHNLNLNIFGNFIVMATELMYIKSRMLLPKPDKYQSINSDPRSKLVHQLVIYKKYKHAAKGLQQLEIRRHQLHTRSTVIPSRSNHFIDLRNQLNVKVLKTVFNRIIRRKVRHQPIYRNITEWHYSIQSQSRLIINLLKRHRSLSFKTIFVKKCDLEELITNFLAILDLMKSHLIVMDKSSMTIRLIC